jgi:hypothetical protein
MPDDIAAYLVSLRYNTSSALDTLHILLNRYPKFATELNELWTMLDDNQRTISKFMEH